MSACKGVIERYDALKRYLGRLIGSIDVAEHSGENVRPSSTAERGRSGSAESGGNARGGGSLRYCRRVHRRPSIHVAFGGLVQ